MLDPDPLLQSSRVLDRKALPVVVEVAEDAPAPAPVFDPLRPLRELQVGVGAAQAARSGVKTDEVQSAVTFVGLERALSALAIECREELLAQLSCARGDDA